MAWAQQENVAKILFPCNLYFDQNKKHFIFGMFLVSKLSVLLTNHKCQVACLNMVLIERILILQQCFQSLDKHEKLETL